MNQDILIEPMPQEFILWRCLHWGPLLRSTIDRWPKDSHIPWQRYRDRNLPLLLKLTQTYGACAITARNRAQVAGMLRFYPREVWNMQGAGGLCLQQDYPNGPADRFADLEFPPISRLQDRTLTIHCMMTGSSQLPENPYQRQGIGSHMVKKLIDWARANGWERIRVDAFEEIPLIYEITGSAGYSFWEKLGFSLIDRYPHPHLQKQDDFVKTLEQQAKAIGISVERAKDKLVMQIDLSNTDN